MNAMKPAKIIKNTSLIGTPVVFPPELAMPPAMAEARVSEIPMAEAVVEPADETEGDEAVISGAGEIGRMNVCLRRATTQFARTEKVKVSGRRPSQVAGQGTSRRTETAHVRTCGQRATRNAPMGF
jgi:hypothetical protein